MPRAEPISNQSGQRMGWYVHCPACKHAHVFYTTPEAEALGYPRWTFNGDAERPTFRASMLVYEPRLKGSRRTICHSFVTDGQIRYLDDCAHAMAGQTVDLPDLDD